MSTKTEDTLTTQTKSLILTIQNAEKSELTRMKKLSLTLTSGERESLQRRFDKERLMDQQRIENLTNDLFILNQKISNGERIRPDSSNSINSKGLSKTSFQSDGSKHNRFVGLENHNDRIFYQDIVKKFDKHDEKFYLKHSLPKYNQIEEHKKLNLLTEKRNLLKQLVTLSEMESNNNNTSTSRMYNDTASVISSSNRSITTSSNASYATFATNINRIHNNQSNKIQNHNIPKLNFKKI